MNSYNESLFVRDLMWGYGKPVEETCRDMGDVLGLHELFTLEKLD